MLEHYFHSARFVARLRSSSVGAVVDAYVDDMHDRGYSHRTMDGYVRAIERFGRWLKRKGCVLDSLNESTIEEYLKSGRRRRTKHKGTRAGLSRLLAAARACGLVAPRPAPEITGTDTLITDFLEHLKRVRGLRAATCTQRQHYVHQFLTARFSGEVPDLGKINADDLRAFVASLAEQGNTRAAKCAASSLRAFLRYLVLRGMCAQELVDTVPTVAHRGTRLPGRLSDDQGRRLLAAFDRTRSVGRRDYAIALCMMRLGLRVGETVELTLDDFSWRDGTVRIGSGKSRRPAVLPLPKDVGQAVSEYVRKDRRLEKGRYVFTTHVAPLEQPLNASAARSAIRRAFNRTGLNVPSKGTHIFRHTIASNLVSCGSSLKEVADVLRHRCLDTTKLYTRVDLSALRSVAMSWPEVCK